MSRIIGGSAGGRRLETPRGDGTRPTSDRVREALFSALQSRLGSLNGLHFLDLYAGSGAVGLEARSRGAERVTLVEQDRKTAAVISANVATLGFDGCTVATASVHGLLSRPARESFDVVFLDPPYLMTNDEVAADLLALVEHGWLDEDAVIVVERSRRGGLPAWPAGISEDGTKKYGETLLGYGRADGSHPVE